MFQLAIQCLQMRVELVARLLSHLSCPPHSALALLHFMYMYMSMYMTLYMYMYMSCTLRLHRWCFQHL